MDKIIRVTLAASITCGLFLLMGYLIIPRGEIPKAVVKSPTIIVTRAKRNEQSLSKRTPKPDKPERQIVPPLPAVPKPKVQNANKGDALVVIILETPSGGSNINTTADRRATPIVRFPPQYPAGPLQRNIEGWVLVGFTITHTGTVADMTVVDAEPKGTFNKAALKAIKRWKYQPKIENRFRNTI